MVLARSETATRRCEWPKSTPTAAPALASKLSRIGGRPPCAPWAKPGSGRSTTSPSACRSATRLDTVERLRPVRRAISARLIIPSSRSARITRRRLRRRRDSSEPARPGGMEPFSFDRVTTGSSIARTNRPLVGGPSWADPRASRPARCSARPTLGGASGRTSAGTTRGLLVLVLLVLRLRRPRPRLPPLLLRCRRHPQRVRRGRLVLGGGRRPPRRLVGRRTPPPGSRAARGRPGPARRGLPPRRRVARGRGQWRVRVALDDEARGRPLDVQPLLAQPLVEVQDREQ